MKKIIYLFLFFISACTTSNLSVESDSDPDPFLNIFEFMENVKVHGNNYFIVIPKNGPDDLSMKKIAIELMVKELKDQLDILNFKEVSDRLEAHLVIGPYFVDASHTASSNDNAKSVQQKFVIDKFENGKRILIDGSKIIDFGFTIQSYGYGIRPRVMYWVATRSSIEVFSDPSVLRSKAKELVSKISLKPVKTITSGKPSCYPRFGFSIRKLTSENGEKIYQITQIIKKLGAEKAGLKVGDEIIAIDSIPYENIENPTDEVYSIYESKKVVPIKFKRNGEILRSQVQSQIGCE